MTTWAEEIAAKIRAADEQDKLRDEYHAQEWRTMLESIRDALPKYIDAMNALQLAPVGMASGQWLTEQIPFRSDSGGGYVTIDVHRSGDWNVREGDAGEFLATGGHASTREVVEKVLYGLVEKKAEAERQRRREQSGPPRRGR
ncbi:hypothetical protein ACWEQ4_00770 [Rhodococcus sp. NPDC003994]